MPCPSPTTTTPVTAPKTFLNWARAVSFTTGRAFRPSLRGEIVSIIRAAERAGQRVKWTGSLWSFMGVYVSNDVVIESDLITGAIDNALILNRLTLADPSIAGSLAHVRGGTKVFNVNRILHGLAPAANGGGADEVNLDCMPGSRALPTLGGSGGQSIAGVMATGSHGGDIHLPPIADAVMAIHLIGPNGQEWWIERSSGLTAGTEEDTQRQLRSIAATVPGAAVEMCEDIIVKKDDNLFRAVLVSVGRMGFVYSLVVKSVPAFKLHETRSNETWETFRTNLTAANFPTFAARRRFVQILINPFNNGGRHDCKVAVRGQLDCSTPNEGMGASTSFDFMALICQRQDVRSFLPILLLALAGLVATVGLLLALASVELAAASALAAIPFIGWALAAALFAAYAATMAAVVALSAAIVALTALISYLALAGSMTAGELIARVANFAYSFGMKGLFKALLVALFNSAYPILSKIGVSWKIMDTYGYAGEDFCQKVDSMEIAFDVAATGSRGGYLAFIDEVLMIFDDLFNRNIAVAGLLALRYTTNTTALIGMSKFRTTCHIEIPIIRDFAGNAEFMDRVQRAAIAHDGVPHWGQMMGTYTALDIRRLHSADLLTWRRQLTQLIRRGSGANQTFSNNFTATYNLEPLDDRVITAVRFTVTVGDDSLGDTDIFRHEVSADFVRVTLLDGTFFEVGLNEGSEWHAHTTHVRDVAVTSGTMWGDVASVRIRHVAAGGDINADNWTMNTIVVSSIGTTSSDVRVEFSQSGTPVWQFRKNDHQIWQHDF